MRKKISVVFFFDLDPIKNVNFYGLEEDEVRFLVDQVIVARDIDWKRYELINK